MSKPTPHELAAQAWASFQAGDVEKAEKQARAAAKAGVPFARSVTRKIHEVIGAGVVIGEQVARDAKAAAAAAKAAADKK